MKKFLTLFLSLFFVMNVLTLTVRAESSTEATKATIASVKNDVKGKSNYTSILMIAGVIAIVGLAIYLSFSDDKKTPAKK
jgi:hypothetical protein